MVVLICILTPVGFVISNILLDNRQKSEFDDLSSITSTVQTTELETDPEIEISTIITTTNPPQLFKIVQRDQWGALKMHGDTKLVSLLTRVIIMDTKTETCDDPTACEIFVRKRQAETYSNFVHGFLLKDIPENFLIASDGTIYEGRGFTYEGQHTYDLATTSYNYNVIGVSFIGDFNHTQLSQKQEEAFIYFTQKSIRDGRLARDYKLYFIEQLVGSNKSKSKLFQTIKSFENWEKSNYFITIYLESK